MGATFARDDDVFFAVAIHVSNTDLKTDTRLATMDFLFSEYLFVCMPAINIDHRVFLATRIFTRVGTDAFAGEEFGLAVPIEVFPDHGVGLGEFFVDGVDAPVGGTIGGGLTLLHPLEAIVVAVAPDDIVAAIAIEVDNEHGRTCVIP